MKCCCWLPHQLLLWLLPLLHLLPPRSRSSGVTLDEASGRMRKSTHSDSCVNQSVADKVGAGTQHAPGCGPKPDWSCGSLRMRGSKLPFPGYWTSSNLPGGLLWISWDLWIPTFFSSKEGLRLLSSNEKENEMRSLHFHWWGAASSNSINKKNPLKRTKEAPKRLSAAHQCWPAAAFTTSNKRRLEEGLESHTEILNKLVWIKAPRT